jgi:hypothetical protein
MMLFEITSKCTVTHERVIQISKYIHNYISIGYKGFDALDHVDCGFLLSTYQPAGIIFVYPGEQAQDAVSIALS